VLDLVPIGSGSTATAALQHSTALIRRVEELGFHRYWVAEHHGMPGIASSSPAVLIAHLAGATSRIRVGSGGVMLPNHQPLVIAEQFGTLDALHPGRIDLGIGRAPGSDRETMFALQRDRRQLSPDDFPEQLAELLAYLEDDFPAGHRLAPLAALPGLPETPEVWLLGSSPQSAIWAGELGLPYAFADFINPAGAEIAELYRARFQPSRRRSEPEVAVAVSAICAETDEEARRISLSQRMAITLLRQGRLIAVPTVERAERFFEDTDPDAGTGRRLVAGSPSTVRAGLEQVAADYGAAEAIVVTITFDHQARRRSYELLATEFALP
jgi:luciferase family oxidoreductase group 1